MADYDADILVDGEWIPVKTLGSDGVRITGGRARDAGAGDPLTVSATLINQDGRLTPRNPQSDLFGKIGQGTQLRITRPDDTHLWIPGQTGQAGALGGAGATTPDHASFAVTDLDVRFDVEPASWRGNAGIMLGGQYLTTGNLRGWACLVDENMYPWVRWSPDGTLASSRTVIHDVRIPVSGSQRITLRFTIDADNGAGLSAVRFYYAFDGVDSAAWTQLGGGWTTPATPIFNSTTALAVGRGTTSIITGNSPSRVYAMRLCSGIDGAAVANPNFAAQAPGATSLVDGAGRSWTLASDAEIREFDVRGVGELAKWPTRWTTFEELTTAPVQAYGLRKRLSRPSGKLRSALFREAVAADNLPRMVEYWPGEDASGSSQLASGVAGGAPMLITGSPSLGNSDRIPGSEPLITMTTGASLRGPVRFHAATGQIGFRMVIDFPEDFTAAAFPVILAEITCSGAINSARVKWWRLQMDVNGSVKLVGLNSFFTVIANGNNINYDLFGRRQMFAFNVVQNGGDVDWITFARRINEDLTVTQVQFNQTFSSVFFGRAQELKIGQQGDMDGVTVGHFMVGNSQDLAAGIDTAIVGNDGETAGARAERLARELGIKIRLYGQQVDSARMGPQPVGTAIELLDLCADTDGGVIVDARDELALVFHLRNSIYNGVKRAEITYDLPGQSPALLPEEPGDDVINDMTVSRIGGSFYRAIETEGALGTTALGYALDGSDDLNLETDAQLSDAAWWLTYLNTWDEFRYPEVEFDLLKLTELGDAAVARALAAIEPTDRIYITNPPADLPKHPIDLLAQGFAEEMRYEFWHLKFNTTPGRPWQVGRFAETPVDSDHSELTNPIDADDVTFQVTVEGVPWAEDSLYPLTMWIRRAERVLVTNITGTSSPQTFTVTRGIDGDAMEHPAGAVLELWEPLRLAR